MTSIAKVLSERRELISDATDPNHRDRRASRDGLEHLARRRALAGVDRECSRVEPLGNGPFAVGYRARVLQPKLPRAVWRVTELEEGRRFVWIYTSPGVRLTASHCVEPSGRGTRAESFVAFSGPFGGLVGRLTRATTEKYLTMEAEGLKARSEERAFGRERARVAAHDESFRDEAPARSADDHRPGRFRRSSAPRSSPAAAWLTSSSLPVGCRSQ